MKNVRAVLATLAVFMALNHVSAQTTYSFSGSTPIPDNSPAGVNMDIIVTDPGEVASIVSVDVTWSVGHTWVGDLVATLILRDPGDTTTLGSVLLHQRVGSSTVTGVGDSSNLAVGTYTFSNTLALTDTTNPRLVDAANDGGTSFIIPTGVYRPTNNTFNGVGSPTNTGEIIQDLTAPFAGLDLAGIWRLNVADLAGGDTGTVSGWSFTVVPVPEPTSVLLGGLGLVGLSLFARKKSQIRRRK